MFFELLTEEKYDYIHTIKISYNSIRPKGERLLTFGGTASGHESIKEMFEGIEKVLKNKIDESLSPMEREGQTHRFHVRPIHILDICNLIGNNVVVGGVRRTAEIFLMDEDDWECILAKYGINGIWNWDKHVELGLMLENLGVCPSWWFNLKPNDPNARPLHHRRMSNNSIAFTKKPSREMLHLIFQIMQGEGEPGFVNLESAKKRRPNAEGLNPCAEILLDSYGVCNLTTVNVKAFVKEGVLDYSGLMQAQALSTRAGLRMTCLDLELPHWDKIQKRDRLLGCSLTGWQDAMELLGYTKEQEDNLKELLSQVAHQEAISYAHVLRIPTPLLITTVKPEGTLSQVAGGVSSGLHRSHAPYYIRRIRINAEDPLAKVAMHLGWVVNPEVGTHGKTHEERMANARTLVIDFPVKSGAKRTRDSQTIEEQFDTYFRFQELYTDHNSSNTISVRSDEWEIAEEIVWNKWDDFIGVSFLAYDGGNYELAPYEEITEEQYNELKSRMKPFQPELLKLYETTGESEIASAEECENGVCPIR